MQTPTRKDRCCKSTVCIYGHSVHEQGRRSWRKWKSVAAEQSRARVRKRVSKERARARAVSRVLTNRRKQAESEATRWTMSAVGRLRFVKGPNLPDTANCPFLLKETGTENKRPVPNIGTESQSKP